MTKLINIALLSSPGRDVHFLAQAVQSEAGSQQADEEEGGEETRIEDFGLLPDSTWGLRP